MDFKSINWKDLATRAFWTFVEGFLVALPAGEAMGMDIGAWKAALIAAVMAGVSAVKTLIVELIRQRKV